MGYRLDMDRLGVRERGGFWNLWLESGRERLGIREREREGLEIMLKREGLGVRDKE